MFGFDAYTLAGLAQAMIAASRVSEYIEVLNAGRPAWLAKTQGLDVITFEFDLAEPFYDAFSTMRLILMVSPHLEMQIARGTPEYIARHRVPPAPPSLPAPAGCRQTPLLPP